MGYGDETSREEVLSVGRPPVVGFGGGTISWFTSYNGRSGLSKISSLVQSIADCLSTYPK